MPLFGWFRSTKLHFISTWECRTCERWSIDFSADLETGWKFLENQSWFDQLIEKPHVLDFVTYRGVDCQAGEVDGVELNVEVRVEEEAGGVVSQVQPLSHHHHHHPQPRPPGGGLHTAGLPRVQGGRVRGLHHDDAVGQQVQRIWIKGGPKKMRPMFEVGFLTL